jgi:polyphosphate kinase 2 (PPK2 family)
VVICEGRDSAGKGGTVKRITYRLYPRVVRVVALSTPTEKESSDETPEACFELRIHDPRRRWKLSTMVLEARAGPFNLVPKDYS